MASHFKWYPSSSEVTVPWNARYSFPSQVSIKVFYCCKISPQPPYSPDDQPIQDFQGSQREISFLFSHVRSNFLGKQSRQNDSAYPPKKCIRFWSWWTNQIRIPSSRYFLFLKKVMSIQVSF